MSGGGGVRRRGVALRAAAAAVFAAAALTPSPAAAVERCYADLVDDVLSTPKDDPEAIPRPISHPPVDIERACGEMSATTLRLAVDVAEATDPLEDPSWASPHTSLLWVLDTHPAAGNPDFGIDIRLEEGALRARVVRPDGSTACAAQPSVVGPRFAVVVEVGCLGSPTSVSFVVHLTYDRRPDAQTGPIYSDDTTRILSREVGRLAGGDRIATAAAIASAAFPTAGVVYLAGVDALADAVAAGAVTDGPVLLVPRCSEPPAAVRAAMGRIAPRKVVALGGPGAICQAVVDSVANGREQARLAGRSRIDTAVAISRAVFPQGASVAYLAGADRLADAVAAGSLTAGPVLLVPSAGGVPPAVLEEVRRLGAQRVVAIGGRSAVPQDVLLAAAQGRPTGRLSGPTRIDTAVAIAEFAFPTGAEEVYLAGVDSLADAVAGGALTRGPVVLVERQGALPPAVDALIPRLDPRRVVALGGPAAVSDAVLSDASTP